jgi:hypothetical protein
MIEIEDDHHPGMLLQACAEHFAEQLLEADTPLPIDQLRGVVDRVLTVASSNDTRGAERVVAEEFVARLNSLLGDHVADDEIVARRVAAVREGLIELCPIVH